jgi:hypothetical protein
MRQPKPQTTITVFSEKIEGSERKSLSGRDEADYLVGEVSYTKGGINYFSGNVSKRGYRISVQMQTKGDGFTSFMIGGGICQSQWVEEAKMLSGKRLAALVMDETIRARLQTIKAECLAIYRAKHPVDEAVAV